MAKDTVIITRALEYDSRDVIVSFNKVAERMFGKDPFMGTKTGWRPRESLGLIRVKIGLDKEVKVATGHLEIRGLKGQFNLAGSIIEAYASKDETSKVEAFLSAVEKDVKSDSIYKCKAVTSSGGFMDLSNVSGDKLVYNDRIFRELNDNLWVMIEKSKDCQKAGVRLQRKVLFEGKFGTGKTESLLLTARKGIDNGFTFYYLEPTTPNVSEAIPTMLSFARLYSPAIVAIEDFDREQRAGNSFSVGRLMVAIDGALSKNSDIIVVMTTNYKDKIVGGLKRPGRIDKSINFNTFEPNDIAKLLKLVIPDHFLDPNIDWQKIGSSASHFTPAFIKEIGTGATLAAISRARTGDPIVTEEILSNIIDGLQEQHKACEADGQVGFSSES